MDEEYDIKIHVTDEYDKFKKMLGNRDVKGVSKIVESVQAVGQIQSPIVVNENYEVIDGQNRLEAFKQMGRPIYYMMIPGLDIEACRRLNIGQTNWGMEDWVSSYAQSGNASYQRLASLINEYKKPFHIEGILALANPLTIVDSGARAREQIKPGKYTLSKEEYEAAVRRLSSAESLGYVELCKSGSYGARIFWAAVAYIYINPTITAEAAIEKLSEYKASIPATKTVSEQLRFMEAAINGDDKRRKGRVFLQADFVKGEYFSEEYVV